FVLRNPGYNVAYWNLHERTIAKDAEGYRVNSMPLYFFHFSGFMADQTEKISKYQTRHHVEDFPALKGLLEMYRSLLLENGYRESTRWPYYYGRTKRGSPIPQIARTIYWGLGADRSKCGNPFEHFCLGFLKPGNFAAFFTERFLRALLDRTLMGAWEFFRRVKLRR
ncbi:MAG: hypothetical protein M0Z60_00425, partial [Nitrospiraceae bacterium]|nr:hypothetical protein [Nitrospiraceae bacterium]